MRHVDMFRCEPESVQAVGWQSTKHKLSVIYHQTVYLIIDIGSIFRSLEKLEKRYRPDGVRFRGWHSVNQSQASCTL
jgi:hypothetical protein